MSDIYTYILALVLFFIIELLYFRIAVRYKIIDKPNERSSHQRITVRGGGIIFPIAVICWALIHNFQYPFFLLALLLISMVSFVDDILNLHSKIRFFVQIIAVSLIFWQLPLGLAWYWYFIASILIIGVINAYNFMDGINGITGIYSLITLLSLIWVNQEVIFLDNTLLVFLVLALLVFGFFNFRKKAKCFAGDIGSVSIAFSICFFLILLISKANNFLYVLFLLIYGLDAVTTIIFRLIRRENIFEAHRTHFYQYLSNELGWPHLVVSAVYAIIQLAINAVIIGLNTSVEASNPAVVIVISVVLGVLVLFFRLVIEGNRRLLSGKS